MIHRAVELPYPKMHRTVDWKLKKTLCSVDYLLFPQPLIPKSFPLPYCQQSVETGTRAQKTNMPLLICIRYMYQHPYYISVLDMFQVRIRHPNRHAMHLLSTFFGSLSFCYIIITCSICKRFVIKEDLNFEGKECPVWKRSWNYLKGFMNLLGACRNQV